MSSGPSINIAQGLPGTQISTDQVVSENIAKKNEERVRTEFEINFFVGPNGKILPKELKEWIGTNKRNSLLKSAKDTKLINAINQLYRPNSFIGDGGTADVIRFEKATGLGLGRQGNTHIQKGREMLKYIKEKILKNTDLSETDRRLAIQLATSLEKALLE